jgi:hypothetical protein
MKTLAATIALPSLLATMLVGCVADDDTTTPELPAVDKGGHLPEYASDPYGLVPTFRPSKCQDIKDYVADAKDGEFTLYYHNEPTARWKVYCANMQSQPTEYLSLSKGDGLNTSTFSDGSKQVTTTYEKVRIHPESLSVDLGDTTFAVSSGMAMHSGTTITMMPFGIAMSCNAAPATMNINLRGTQFRLESALQQFGTSVKQMFDLSSDRQVLTTTVTGNCGWVAQRGEVKPTSDVEQFELRLSLFLPPR